jgi:hypothetical protein
MKRLLLAFACVLTVSTASAGETYYRDRTGAVVSNRLVPDARARGYYRYYPSTAGVSSAGNIQGWRPYDLQGGRVNYRDTPRHVSPYYRRYGR